MSKVEDIIQNTAPIIGTILAGAPGGIIAQKVSNIFFGHNDASIDQINQAASKATPEQLIELKTLENNFLSQQNTLIDYQLKNTINAREHNQDLEHKKTTTNLAYIIVIGFFTIILLLMIMFAIRISFDGVMQAIINILVGQWAAAFGIVIGFYFGSSVGSKIKDWFNPDTTPQKINLPKPFK